jgi:hypothetical protein
MIPLFSFLEVQRNGLSPDMDQLDSEDNSSTEDDEFISEEKEPSFEGTQMNSEESCFRKIYRECTHESRFSEEEIDNARKYIQKRFAVTNPKRRPCAKLRVRKNVKCLTREEYENFVYVIKKLYSNGVIDRFTKIHNTYWPAAHKFGEGLNWHRWFINELEKEMLKINPSVTMPYWEYMNEFSAPEKSIIWDLFGHAGNETNDYCIKDGPFAYQRVRYPKPHCVRRQWNRDGTIPLWEPPEWITAINQIGVIPSFLRPLLRTLFLHTNDLRTATDLVSFVATLDPTLKPWSQYSILLAYVAHFKTHLASGGYNGELSIPIATNDILFYLFHEWQADYVLLKWQLTEDKNLVPQSYNLGIKLVNETQKIVISDIDSDFLTYYKNISVKESFQIGFGDLCYIHDQMIKPINQLIRNEKNAEPEAIKRLRTSLPATTFARYFPKFALYPNEVNFFDYVLPQVGDCNTNQCRPMPTALRFTDTDNGRRQFKSFIKAANFDITPLVTVAESYYYEFINELNRYHYCSPYA